MANRQIYQLDTETDASASMLSVIQTSDGVTEAKKIELRELKIAMRGYSCYSAFVTFSAGPTFNTNIVENDFLGTNFTFDNPSNGTIRVTASDPVFVSGLTFSLSGAVNDAGTPYFLTGSRFSDTEFNFKILLHDGTGASTPFFSDVFFEIRVIPD